MSDFLKKQLADCILENQNLVKGAVKYRLERDAFEEELRESKANHNNLKDVYDDAEKECKVLREALYTIRCYAAKDPTKWAVDVANIAADALKYEDEDEEELDCTGVKKKNWL